MEITGIFKRFLKSKSMSLVIVIIAVVAFFYIMNPNYLGRDNVRGIMNAMSMTGIVGVGTALLLMGGGINLAAGSEGCFGAIFVAVLISTGLPWPLAILLGLVFGMCAGLINSFFVNKLNFLGFIATLGMASVYTGFSLIVTMSVPVPISDQSFWGLAEYAVFGFIPMSFAIMICIMIIYGFILNKTRFGRSILMCGGNRSAARLAGLNPKKTTTILYMNSGMLSTIAGSLLASRMHSASHEALSSSAIDAITAAVLGGVSFIGGSGSISGLFFGTLLLNAFSNGLVVIGMTAYWQLVLQGMVLIIALCVDYYSTKARNASLKKARIKQSA